MNADTLDGRKRFDATADDYALFRPGYPMELVDWVARRAGLAPRARVLDLGCGTGIASRLFALRGFDVVGVDPSEGMLARARLEEGGARYVRAEASATGLAGASVDLAIAGQAFHWFPLEPTLRELRRVLRPHCACAAFWNVRAASPLNDEYEAMLRALVPGYDERPQSAPTVAAIAAAPGVVDVEETELPNSQVLPVEAWVGRVRSSSYVAHLDVGRGKLVEDAARALFRSHEKGGAVEIAYRTVVVLFGVEPPVALRPVAEGDLPILFEQQRDPEYARMAAFTHEDPDDREAFLAHQRKILADPAVIARAIVLDGEVVGSVASWVQGGEREVTYGVGRAHWGKGIATAALRAFLREVKERPLHARAATDNGGSVNVLEKCGFEVKGRARGFANARGKEIEELLLRLD